MATDAIACSGFVTSANPDQASDSIVTFNAANLLKLLTLDAN
ncbi:MAG: hypothetical protein ACU83N_00080 [Gammaproteobacteria bacterium]